MIPYRDSFLRFFRPFTFGFFALFLTVSGLKGYDSPDFEREIFDVDGLFLEDNSRDSLLEALASVVSNFSGSDRVDSDLREKCIALSLRISPLHHNSRVAHDFLMKGENPPATSFFTSLPSASEAIWGVAERMGAKGAEPAARKLAPYLMEISLYLHPKPPRQRIELFAELTGKEFLAWGEMVKLQPADNPSSSAARKMFERLESRDERKEEREEMGTAKAGEGPAAPASPVAGNASEVKFNSVSMPFISSLIVRGDAVAGGLATLKIRESDPGEEDLFGLLKPDDDPARATQMQMVGDSSGIMPAGLRTISATVRQKYPVWPQMKVAEIGFSTKEELSTPRTMMQADMTLPGSIMIHSAFSGLPIDGEIIFCGSLGDSAASKDTQISVDGRVEGILASGNLMDKPYLILPSQAFDAVLESIKKSEDLSVLFSPQLIAVDDFSGAIELATAPRPDAFLAATRSYLEIEEVASKMSLVDLAKNSKVQERLVRILEDYPNHLSAKVMLAYGRGE